MRERWRNWLNRLVTVNARTPKESQQGQFLSFLIMGLLVSLLVVVLINVAKLMAVFSFLYLFYVIGDVLCALVLVGIWCLNRAGRTRWASYTCLIFIVVIGSMIFDIDTLDRVLIIYTIPIVAASFIIGPASTFVFAALSVLGYSLAYLASESSIGYNYVAMPVLFVIALLSWLVVNRMEEYVTELKQTEDALVASKTYAESIIQNFLDTLIVVNAEAKIQTVNPATCRLLGYTEEELKGQSMSMLFAEEEIMRVFQFFRELEKAKPTHPQDTIHNRELTYKTKDGRLIPMLFSASMLTDEVGHVTGVVAGAKDITDIKQAEEQIQRQVEILSTLYDLSRTLAEIEDFDAILDLVTRCAVESAHVTFARVLLLEQGDLVTKSVFPVRVLDQDLQVGLRWPLAAYPFCQRVLEGNAPLVLQADSPEAGECAPFFFLGVAQALSIPLYVHKRPLGFLMLSEVRNAAHESFTADKIRLARSIGDQAGSALHRSLLHDETEHRLQRITALRSIDQAISGSFDLRMMLNITLKQAMDQLNVDAASVLLLNPHTQTLEYAAGCGFRSKGIERSRLRFGQGLAGCAVMEKRTIHLPNLSEAGEKFKNEPLASEAIQGYAAVPLISKGWVKGVLEVFLRSHRTMDDEWLEFLEILAGQVAIAADNVQLFNNLQDSNMNLVLAYNDTIKGWSTALDLRDKETKGHSQRITETTIQLARSLGIGEAELMHIRRGALLHDIGKMGIPDSILLKPGPLTDEEWVIMRQHPQHAFNMLFPIVYLRPALDIPYCHHEKWDGTGYPRGLKDEQIPLAARIFAVVDVYDSLISDRPYRKAWTREKAIEYIKAGTGSHFDPKVERSFPYQLLPPSYSI